MTAQLLTTYSGRFYRNRRRHTETSAKAILSIVAEHISLNTVIDVGCGTGTWLSTAMELGASRIAGIEGGWVSTEMLDNPAIQFVNSNIAQSIPDLGRFDLAINLEVAEHLPPNRAESLVDDLCRLSDSVLFGAAVPGQGGKGHINEQWQSYWRGLFEGHNYQPWDIIRGAVWDNQEVLGHYKQNTILYVRNGEAKGSGTPFDLVHPDVFHHYTHPGFPTSLRLLKRLPNAFAQSLKKFRSRQGV